MRWTPHNELRRYSLLTGLRRMSGGIQLRAALSGFMQLLDAGKPPSVAFARPLHRSTIAPLDIPASRLIMLRA